MPERKAKKKEPLAAMDGTPLSIIRDYTAVIHTDVLQKNRYMLNGNKTGLLSAREQKVILAVVSRIKPDDTTLEPQDFNIKEFCSLCGISDKGGKPLKDVFDVINRLASRVLWLYEPKSDGKGETITAVHWLHKATINPSGKSYVVRIYLDKEMAPFLIGLRQNYTKLYFHDILRMRSRYSIILYQLLSSFAFLHRPVSFDVRDLQERLDCVKPSYTKNFNAFHRRVLDPAVEEINKYSSLKVGMKFEKTGRSVTKVVFFLHMLRDSDSVEDQREYTSRYERVEIELGEDDMSFMDELDATCTYDASTNLTVVRDGEMAIVESEIPPLFSGL